MLASQGYNVVKINYLNSSLNKKLTNQHKL
jgi:hypothetical protein